MKVKLVFADWTQDGKSVYNTQEGVDLSIGSFHSGSTFHCEIQMDAETEEDLRKSLEKGFEPVFFVIEDK